MSHQQHQELLAVYALDALDASDAQALEDHLSTCSECRVELVELRDATALLAHGASPSVPSADVRKRVMDAVRLEPRPQIKKSDRVIPLTPRAQPGAWTSMLRLAAAIAFIAVLIGVVVLWRRDVAARRELA